MGSCCSAPQSTEVRHDARNPSTGQSPRVRALANVGTPIQASVTSIGLHVSTSVNSILVSGISEKTDEEVLKLFFQNKRKSGGGPVESVDCSTLTGKAVITFLNADDAHRVTQRGNLSLDGASLTICPASSPSLPLAKSKTHTILVSGISERTDEEVLKLFFQNKRKSGGGPVKRVDYSRLAGQAVITFRNAEDADRVLQSGVLSLDSASLTTRQVNSEGSASFPSLPGATSKTHTILVSGISKITDEEVLKLFFQNKRKSGGGPVKKVDYNRSAGQAVINFHNADDAERVLQRGKLSLDGTILTLALHSSENQHESEDQSAARTPSAAGSTMWRVLNVSTSKTSTILVHGINVTTDEEVLKLFFESKRRSGGGPVQGVDYRKSTGQAVITFYNADDAERVLQRGNLSLEAASLTVALHSSETQHESEAQLTAQSPSATGSTTRKRLTVSTSKTNTILVRGIKDTTDEEVLKLFFESHRSGGGPVQNIDFTKSTGEAIITFRNAEDAERVLQRVNLSLEGASLTLDAERVLQNRNPSLNGESLTVVQV